MTKKNKLFGFFILTMILLVTLSACGSKTTAEDEQATADAAITQVVETAMVALTQTASVQTPTPSTTPTILPTNTLIPTLQPSPTLSTLVSLPTASGGSPGFTQPSGPTSSCDIGGFVRDVTIPDGTNVTAGQSFTKTWEIKNNGTCTWNKNYRIVFYGGEQLAADTSFTFTTDDVEPGETVQISVPMTAPNTTGEFISYWILRNDLQQNFFVDGSSIYVEIIVGSPSTATPTNTAGPSPTPTFTATPANVAPSLTASLSSTPPFSTGVAINFTGTANDAEDGNLTSSISWSADNGQTGTGGTVSFTFSTAGSHTVTASITDSGGATVTKQITFTVN